MIHKNLWRDFYTIW